MSKINIQGIIENITSKSNVYTPVVEAIVNSIQAIEEKGISDGHIDIILKRGAQLEFSETLPEVVSIEISDNGIGFDNKIEIHSIPIIANLRSLLGAKASGDFFFQSISGM